MIFKQWAVAIIIGLVASTSSFGQQTTDFSFNDLKFLNGLYTGTLTYKDYSSNEIVTLKLVCNTTQKNEELNLKILINEWGKNYDQNYTYKSKNGKVNGFSLVSNYYNSGNQSFKVVLTQKGKDGNDNKSCLFKYTMIGDNQSFLITKEVKFDDETAYFIRNQYHFMRTPDLVSKELGFKSPSMEN